MNDKLREIELLLSIDENIVETVRNIEQAKKELEVTVDSIIDIVLLIDNEGKIIRGNHAIEGWHLGKVKQVEGISFHDLLHPNCSKEKCHLKTYWALAYEKLLENQSFEYQINDKALNKFLLVQFRPISLHSQIKYEKTHVFAVVTFKDITSRKQAEIQLDQATAELKSIFQVIPDQYIRLKWDGTILDLKTNVNSDSTILLPDSIGKNINMFFTPAIRTMFINAMEEVLISQELCRVEFAMGPREKEQFYEARFVPLMDDQIIMINQNITEKKRLESIAESVDMMKKLGYIFSAIRHEIGNPINAIKMTMSVLKKNIGKYSDEKVMEYTTRVLSEINRVEYLLQSFKSFNMFEDLDSVNLHIGDFLDHFVSLLVDDFKEKGIDIKLNIDMENDMVFADPRALHQVFLNIISNAVDALKDTPEKRIDITATRTSGKIWIDIKDNGHGLPELQQKNLFKPFFTTKKEGTGLGLVIVKKILTRMEGEISIESTENMGAVVSIAIPEGKIEAV